MIDLANETVELLNYLESRNLNKTESSAVIGFALEALFEEPAHAREFLSTFAKVMNITDMLK